MIDLHLHSNISAGGDKSVEEILIEAEKNKIKALSITDHNSALASVLVDHINKDSYFGGRFISGAEIDVVHNGVTFELLAYNFNSIVVQNWLYEKFETLPIRQKIIRKKLMDLCIKNDIQIDKDFPWNSKVEFAHENVYNNFKQFKNNEKKLKINLADSSDFYRNSTTNKDFVLYMDMSFLWASVEEVAKIIHENGGIIVLAHPYGYSPNVDVENLLKICLQNKVDGIEVFHPHNNAEQQKYLLDFCKKHNLLITGGSDYHNISKGNKLFDYKIPYDKISKQLL